MADGALTADGCFCLHYVFPPGGLPSARPGASQGGPCKHTQVRVCLLCVSACVRCCHRQVKPQRSCSMCFLTGSLTTSAAASMSAAAGPATGPVPDTWYLVPNASPPTVLLCSLLFLFVLYHSTACRMIWIRSLKQSRVARLGQLLGFARATSDGAFSATIW
jgi:hypothetical protein